jgi:hypothetical protein
VILKFAAVLISNTRLAQASVSPTLTAGDAARMLHTGGLEIATPVAMGDRLGGFGLAPGDRLGVFTSLPQPGDFPTPVRTGGREVTVYIGGREISTAGRPVLTMGVPDPSDLPLPDIDLRDSGGSSRVNLLPGRCVTLLFDPRLGQWYAALTGGARVVIDDYELTQQPLPVNTAHTLRFYTPLDDPSKQPALANVRIVINAPQTSSAAILPPGPVLLALQSGTEAGPFTLRASDNVRAGQVAIGLSKQTETELLEGAQVARLRLAGENTRITDLLPGEYFYVRT